MYNSDSSQHILTQSNGTVWNFYQDEKLGLCYSTLTRKNSWSNPVSLFKNAYSSFYADIDQDDRFHLLFQDLQGNIIYAKLDGETFITVPVLNSKVPSLYDKKLHISLFKNSIFLFYVLQHEKSPFLACQILSDGKAGSPKVIDYVTESSVPCAIIKDKALNIYAFYQSSDGKYLQLGYKKYNPTQKYWSEFTPVTKYPGNCEFPRVIADNKDVLHLCYQRQSQRQYELVYQQKVPDKNMWTNEVIVHSSAHPFENLSIISLNENIIVYWVREDTIFYNTGGQSGSSWSKPSRYSFPVGRQLVCLHYATNNIYEADKIAVHDIPGCFVGGLKMAFYQPQADSPESLTADDLKNLILESLKLLKDSVEELKEGELNLRDELTRLSSAQQELEKELVKSNVRINNIETQLNQVKALGSRLDALSSDVRAIKGDKHATEGDGSRLSQSF